MPMTTFLYWESNTWKLVVANAVWPTGYWYNFRSEIPGSLSTLPAEMPSTQPYFGLHPYTSPDYRSYMTYGGKALLSWA